MVERRVVHVHPDESVGIASVETARKTHRMIECALPVTEAVRDALSKMPRNFFLKIARHVLADDVPAKRQRQTRFLQPPGTHISDEVESCFLVGELAFVNQKSGVDVPANYCLLDLIEG